MSSRPPRSRPPSPSTRASWPSAVAPCCAPGRATCWPACPVVFLRVGLADAVKRVDLGIGRPLLLGNVRSRIKALLDERTPIYESVATHVVETDGRTPDEVAAEIRELLP